jgi:hypothetical protein
MISYGTMAAPFVPEADAILPFTCRQIAEVNVRILGPERMWGGELHTSGLTIPELQERLNNTGQRTGLRLAGYIIDEQDGALRYHMARLPRRINLAVPEIEVFQRALSEAETTIKQSGIVCIATEEKPTEGPILRVLLGLEEGYFESRRKDLLRQIDGATFSDVTQIRDTFLHRIGDPSVWGINLENASSITAAREAISSVSMSRRHTVDEVRKNLSAEFTVTPALIHSVAPDYIYIEPAVEITAPQTHRHFEAVTLLAAQFHQARFSLEHLDTMEAFNVEILEDSTNNAARFG